MAMAPFPTGSASRIEESYPNSATHPMNRSTLSAP